MADQDVDVAIIGAGPAGSAAALALRAHAPTLSVALLEATRFEGFRVGESLLPVARRVLEHLGVWGRFLAQGHRLVPGTSAAWGSERPWDEDHVFSAHGQGWHLDRAAFDRMLAESAADAGVDLRMGERVVEVERAVQVERGEGWRLSLGSGRRVVARFALDASGAAGVLAKCVGARPIFDDRLVALCGTFDADTAQDARTLVEAVREGWWYTSGLPGGRRVVALVTDAGIARAQRLGERASWASLLSSAPRVFERVSALRPSGPLLARCAGSRCLYPAAGPDWLAVGDAASIFDPLSSQGITKALRSGVFAAYAAGDLLTRGDARGLERFARYVRDEHESYVRVRRDVYRLEGRWPDSPFWSSRHGAG